MKVLHAGKDILLDSELLAYCKVLAQRATKDMPDWKEIRIDEFWQALASNKQFDSTYAGWEPDTTSKWVEIPVDNLQTPGGLDRIAFGIIRTPEAKPKAMSKYELVCEDGLHEDLVLVDKMVRKADKAFPDGWAEIRMDSGGACYAYTNTPVRRGIAFWGFSNVEGKNVGKGRLEWNWETFGIIRTPEAKPKKGKKAEQIKLLAKYAAELSSELSATRAMLAEAQKEILELQNAIEEGWRNGAFAMVKAAQNAEAAIIFEHRCADAGMETVRGASRVVGFVQQAFGTGMLTGEGE